jgi:hypothetical protein
MHRVPPHGRSGKRAKTMQVLMQVETRTYRGRRLAIALRQTAGLGQREIEIWVCIRRCDAAEAKNGSNLRAALQCCMLECIVEAAFAGCCHEDSGRHVAGAGSARA